MVHERIIGVVDDEEGIRATTRSLIRSLGFNVESFESVEGFLSAPGTVTRFACIVSDIQMPGLSGIDLHRLMTQRDDPIPVILMTARTEAEILQQARDSGAQWLLHKPFSADRLIDCIEEATATHTAR